MRRFELWCEGEEAGGCAVVFAVDAEEAVEVWVEGDCELAGAALVQPFMVLARDEAGLVARVRVQAEQQLSVYAAACAEGAP